MSKQEKSEFILEVMPNVKKIINVATDEQIDKLYVQAQEKLNLALNEACYG